MAVADMTQAEWMLRASEIVVAGRALTMEVGYSLGQVDELRLLVSEIADRPPPHRREPA